MDALIKSLWIKKSIAPPRQINPLFSAIYDVLSFLKIANCCLLVILW